ncbi:hypothetical protein WJX74_006980 [Apatococcus lobatus]|uniref:Telomere length regulation protein TEL2 homolog n=1 Tax=Apatococcus lobatus TaxID=904363 RepID=A0AAW1QLJ0_9CHLO
MSLGLKSFVWAACKELQQVSNAEACAQLLRRTAQVLRLSVEDLCELGTPSEAAAEALQRLEAFERLLDQGQGNSWTDRQVFEQAFSYLAEVLLSVVGPVWLPRLRKMQQGELFAAFFTQTTAAIALTTLTSHLSMVQPLEAATPGPSVTVAAADVAADLLVQRFALPGSLGIQELVHLHAGLPSTAVPHSGHQPCPHSGDCSQHAAMLAALPDTCAACNAPTLRSETFIPHLICQLLLGLARTHVNPTPSPTAQLQQPSGDPHNQFDRTVSAHEDQHSQKQQQQRQAVVPPDQEHAIAFVAETLSRLCRRGHAAMVADAFWQAGDHQSLSVPLAPSESHADSISKVGLENMSSSVPDDRLSVSIVLPQDHLKQAQNAHQTVQDSESLNSKSQSPASSSASISESTDPRTQDMQQAPTEDTSVWLPMQSPAAGVVHSVRGSPPISSSSGAALQQPSSAASANAAFCTGPSNQRGQGPSTSSKQRDSFETNSPVSGSERDIARLIGAMQDQAATEKLLVQLLLRLGEAAWHISAGGSLAVGVAWLQDLVVRSRLLNRTSIRYLLAEKMLLQPQLSLPGLQLLVQLLAQLPSSVDAGHAENTSLLTSSILHLAQVWGNAATLSRLPVAHLAYQTAALEAALEQLQKPGLDASGSLTPALLQGVSNHLSSPTPAVRYQGMRVGRTLSILLDPSQQPLFEGQGSFTELLPEECWHPSCVVLMQQAEAADPGIADGPASDKQAGILTDTDSDDPDGTQASDDGFEAYDLTEDDPTDDLSKDGKPLQLRDVAAALRKADDPQGIPPALRAADALVAAHPDELRHYAGELSRSLLYTRPPEWAEEEATSEAAKPGAVRMRTLVSLLAQEPLPAGDALLGQLWTPHLDTHQRVLILDALSSAAFQMSHGPRALLQGPSQGSVGLPAAAPEATANGSRSIKGGHAKSRVWGHRSLALAGKAPPPTHRNRLPEVVLHWAAGLLTDCSKERHGVDLFGRDCWLLGRLLLTLGTLTECASPAPATVQLSGALVELIRSPAVHQHAEPFVRRAALVAASQVIRAIPPSSLAGAILGSKTTASGGSAQDMVVMERLHWVQQWAKETASEDADPECRMLGAACTSLQARLAGAALEHMPAHSPLEARASITTGLGEAKLMLPPDWQPTIPGML